MNGFGRGSQSKARIGGEGPGAIGLDEGPIACVVDGEEVEVIESW